MSKINLDAGSVTSLPAKPLPVQNIVTNQKCKTSVLQSKSIDNDKPTSEISFKEFLDFLRTAYQINEALDGTVDESGNARELDWKEISANKLISSLLNSSENKARKEGDCQSGIKTGCVDEKDQKPFTRTGNVIGLPAEKRKSLTKVDSTGTVVLPPEVNKSVDRLVKGKLNELIQEGLLDSVLPYVVPKTLSTPNVAIKKSLSTTEAKKILDKSLPTAAGSVSLSASKEKSNTGSRRKSSTAEVEVEIHVCDEVKNLKRDFRCPQKLLVSKMGYFAEVTTGQKLEDMDISVHCDITIFDWLMRWVKKDSIADGHGPILDASNVVPILVSAAFLQMDPLLQDCLEYCRVHMNDIVQTSTNLSCINDSILTRLSNLFSNCDLECLKDRKDKIASRLYCKLIVSLTELRPDPARGHFASLASLYKCCHCGKLVVKHVAQHIPCLPANMKMDRHGNVTSYHSRDIHWNLSEYIRGVHGESKSWRAVYWRLWGDCHFLRCAACLEHYPTGRSLWCAHHPDPPQYFTKDNHRAMTFPIGRYPCCGDRSYRFEPVTNRTGCQYKEHEPSLTSEKDVATHALLVRHQNMIVTSPPPIQVMPERLSKLVSSKDLAKEDVQTAFWWDGLELVPPRQRIGILSKWEALVKREEGKLSPVTSDSSGVATESAPPRPATAAAPCTSGQSQKPSAFDSGETTLFSDSSEDSDSSGSDSSDEVSEDSGHAAAGVKPKVRRGSAANRYYADAGGRSNGRRNWMSKLSTRMNQDNQRDYEERAARKMAAMLARRTSLESASQYARTGNSKHHVWHQQSAPPGGTYIKIEQEWREKHCPSTLGYSGRQRSTTAQASKANRYRPPR